MYSAARPINILMVEDSPSDAKLTLMGLKKSKVANNVNLVADGVQAMEYLKNQGIYADAARPDLILLDLNLPKKDGREVLKEIKADPSLKAIPVVILTASKEDADILRSYELNANAYVKKPVQLDGFIEIMKSIEHFWLSVVVLPSPRAQ